MQYSEAIDFLYSSLPVFESQGAGAYKPGLGTTLELSRRFGNPHNAFPAIHVAGTNGKGSTSTLIAAALSAAGNKTGLYTSPHILDFAERIQVDGKPIPHEYVADFVSEYIANKSDNLFPSFFELTTVMMFRYFADCKVDVAVIETGLGGRLDSTNIITPQLSVITNISLDHMEQLGNTLTAIATEKAGIIKPEVPIIIGEADGNVREIFEKTAAEQHAPLIFACDNPLFYGSFDTDGLISCRHTPWGDFGTSLRGDFQLHNIATVLNSLVVLSEHYDIIPRAVHLAFANGFEKWGLKARWMELNIDGRHYLCDTGHNAGAWKYLGPRLEEIGRSIKVRMVCGFVADKDLEAIVSLMPRNAIYYFVEPSGKRARSAESTAEVFTAAAINGSICGSVAEGIKKAASEASDTDLIFVGGSTYVVAEFLNAVCRLNEAR